MNETKMQSSTAGKTFIRPYRPTDQEAVMHVVRLFLFLNLSVHIPSASPQPHKYMCLTHPHNAHIP